MAFLSVSMFGKLQIHLDGEPTAGSMSRKAKELFVYLLLHPRAHPREKLATLLWQHGTTERTKAYLRKALWQLRQSLEGEDAGVESVVRVDGDWVQIHPEADLWVDVTFFEEAFDGVRDCTVPEMSSDQVEALKEATSLYTGDLLENWYHEWCLKERERLKDMLLRMLDRLTRCCEQEGAYDSGIEYGLRALRIDPARERIHRQLMRLRARDGDRTGALRQYERCAEVLDQEMDVSPTTTTRRLYERIQEDRFPAPPPHKSAPPVSQMGDGRKVEEQITVEVLEAHPDARDVFLRDGLDRLRQLQSRLAAVQQQIRREVEAVEIVLEQRG